MKKRRLLWELLFSALFLILLIGGWFFIIAGTPARASVPAILTGYVYLQSRPSHAGVTVQLGDQSTTTDADGGFALANVPTGAQTISASSPGYLSAQGTLDITAGELTPLSEVTLLGGDVNQDEAIDLVDLVILGRNFAAQPLKDPRADLTADGRVDIFDLVTLAINYGKEGPIIWETAPAATPTPN